MDELTGGVLGKRRLRNAAKGSAVPVAAINKQKKKNQRGITVGNVY